MNELTITVGGRDRTLFRASGGNWHVRFQHNGKDILKSLRTTLADVAKQKAKKLIEDTLNDEVMPDTSLDTLVTRFMATRTAMGRGTVANDKCFAANLRSSFHLSMRTPAQKIGAGDILTWLSAQSAARNWRSRTYNHYRLWLFQIFKLGVADKRIRPQDNPFYYGDMIKRRRLDPVRRNIPTEEQFRALIENVRQEECSGEKYADFLDFLGRAGVGQAEACALEWRDVSATKMRFVRRKTRVAFEVPIYSWLVPLITKLRSRSPADQGRVFDVQDAGKALRRACRRLGLVEGKQRPKFTQRSLRAMLIKRLYDAGIPVKRIALWQGHRDGGKLIQEVYTEVFCDTDQAAEDADLARIGAVNMESIAALQVVK